MGSKFSKYSYVVAIDLTHIHAWQATHTFFKPILLLFRLFNYIHLSMYHTYVSVFTLIADCIYHGKYV